MEVRKSRYTLEEAAARITVGRDNEETALKNLSIVEERYKKGILKMTDLLDADTALSEARTRLLNARFDYLQAERDYRLALGKEN
jgi:outer membrane protein TolC